MKPDETAWLVERGQDPVMYLQGSMQWTSNVGQAIRFLRKSDAEQMAASLRTRPGEPVRAAEHVWVTTTTKLPEPMATEVAEGFAVEG